MNILFSCGDYYPNLGGATSLVDDLACVLLDSDHRVSVLTRQHAGMAEKDELHGYSIYRIDYPLCYEKFDWSWQLFKKSPLVLKQLYSFLAAGAFDTVCIGLLDISAWYLFLLRPFFSFRIVLYLHGGETRQLPALEPSYRRLLQSALRFSDAVIAVSDELKVEAGEYWEGALAKTVVIRNAIDLKLMRETIALQRPRLYFATVGRLVPEKDLATLIKAFALIQEQVEAVDLLIVGEGIQRNLLTQLIEDCPFPERVFLLGRAEREEALAIVKGSMFFVLPSVSEGFPIVVVEALAMGRAVIGSKIPGIAAVVEDQRQGYLFPPGDVPALAAILRTCCLQPTILEGLSQGAAMSDLSSYDMRFVATRHLAVFEGNR